MSNTTKIYAFREIKIPRGSLDTINFDNEQQQQNYFINHSSKIFESDNFSPIHEHSVLQVEGLRTLWEQANYLMYQFNGKWYYAFVNGITQSNYDSETNTGTITVEFELDLFQTHLMKIKGLQNMFVIRRHLPNTMTGLSPRIYDEITPMYKWIQRTAKFGLMIESQVVKWVVVVCKNKDKAPMNNGELNPFSMFTFPVLVGKNGFNAVIPNCTVNGTSWGSPISGGVNDTIQQLTGNTTSGNSMTNNVVNLYMIDDIPVSWTVSGNTIVVNDQQAHFITDPVNAIQLFGATASATEEHIDLEDIKTQMWSHLQKNGATEYQLLNSTLCGISLANSYGSMDFEMKQLMHMDTSKAKLLKRSYVTEQGSQVTTLDGYGGSNQIAVQMGIKSTGKAQTVLSNSTATYMQANKNAYNYRQESLNLRQEQMNATQHLQTSNLNKNTAFANRQMDIKYGAVGNAQFMGHEAMGIANTALGGLQSTAMGFATGGIAGGLLAGTMGVANLALKGVDTYQDAQNRGLQQDRDSYAIQYQNQAVNLSQQQAQQNMDMARKAFIAENADRALQPLTINQMGTSQIADFENDLYCENLIYWCADDYSIKMANNELRRDGSYTADYWNLSDILSCRKSFNKVQIAQRITLDLNQAQKEMIETALTKGVRFWNYSNWSSQTAFDGRFMFNYDCDATE